jgi:adenosylcobinamide-phosphate synthase
VAEAAFAAALGLRLGGENRYGDRVEIRPPLGVGRPPEVADVAAAVRLSSDVGTAVAAVLVVAALARRAAREGGPGTRPAREAGLGTRPAREAGLGTRPAREAGLGTRRRR